MGWDGIGRAFLCVRAFVLGPPSPSFVRTRKLFVPSMFPICSSLCPSKADSLRHRFLLFFQPLVVEHPVIFLCEFQLDRRKPWREGRKSEPAGSLKESS